MPPRRKRAAAASGGASSKKAKVAPTLSADEVRFEWEGDAGKWTAYSSEFNEEIIDAFNASKKDVTLDVAAGLQMVVQLQKQVQKNKKTGWERRVRLCIKDSSDSEFYSWEWQDEHNNWNPYLASVAMEVEEAKQNSSATVEIDTFGRTYNVDTKKMKQINVATSVSRPLRRIQSAAEVPKPKPTAGKAASAAKATGSKASTSKVKQEADEDDEEEEKPKSAMRKIVLKGKSLAPVDPECTAKINTSHVYCEGKDIYDVMLNQTNIGNNNNKYYLIQLLKDDVKNVYSVWQRWGRVGFKGQTNLVPCGPDLDDAKQIFTKKFQDKTKNPWAKRTNFVHYTGKYDMVEIDYKADDKEEETVQKTKSKGPEKPLKVPDSKLEKKLQTLINLICDVKAMEDTVMEMSFDPQKAPLGKLTQDQINAGYASLKVIDTCIDKNDFGQKLVQACNDFYTRIPHNFGMRAPPIIKTKAILKAKMQLLEALGDIEIAMKIIKQTTANENPVDTHYKNLKCDLEPLDKSDADFKLVEDCLQNTHAPTHNQYKMKVLDVFAMDKHGESAKFKDVGNRVMLWHGSRLTNWVGILSQGLRIAPPEAPVTGYMFGKGVYFADMSSKSANYCYATKTKTTGLLLLCEVALGKCNELLNADSYANKLPKGTHSVKGMGCMAPDPAKDFKLDSGTVVPMGKYVKTGVKNPGGYTLQYNEFIVYDLSQIKMKYLVKLQFNFK